MFDRTYARVANPAREAAWQKWEAEQDLEGYRMSTMERECARAAFMAGWEARKRAVYNGDAS